MKIFILCLFLFCSCTPTKNISLADVREAFKDLPIKDAVVYAEETDPNKLLGRPTRYIEKMNFNDPRIEKTSFDGVPFNTIEVFANSTDAANRKIYTDSTGKVVAPLGNYSYQHRNVVVRLDLDLLPKDAEAYKTALESIK